MSKIHIAVIDDHDLFREGIRLVLNQIEGFHVVYDTSNGNQFVEILGTTEIDIVLMDIEMPLINGIQTTIKAIQFKPTPKTMSSTRPPRPTPACP